MAKWYRSRKTGKYYQGDDFGDPIDNKQYDSIPQTNPTAPLKPGPPVDSKITYDPGFTGKEELKAPTYNDIFYNKLGRFIPQVTTAVGGIAGAGLGGGIASAGTSAAGAGIGSGVGKILQYLKPELFGEYKPESVMDVASDIGQDVALDFIGTGAGKVLGKAAAATLPSERHRLASSVVKSALFKPTLRKEQIEALKADPNFKVSVGQVNPFARWLEDTFGPGSKHPFVRGQEEEILRQTAKYNYQGPETLIQTAQSNAQVNVAAKKAARDIAYEQFDPFIKKNTRQVRENFTYKTPGFGPAQAGSRLHKIEGAIPLNESLAFSNQVGDDLDKILGKNAINETDISKGLGTPLQRLRVELDKIRGTREMFDPANPTNRLGERLASYERLKAIKDQINDYVWGNYPDPDRNRFKGALMGLAKTIENDIESGVKTWGRGAERQYTKMKRLHKVWAERVDPELSKNLLKAGADEDVTYSQVAKAALSDPQKMRTFIKVTDDRATARNLFFDDLYNNALDPSTNRFNAKRALDYMQNNKEVAHEVLPRASQARTNFEHFLRRAELVSSYSEGSNVALKLRAGTAALTVGAGLTTAALGGNVPQSAGVGTLVLGGAWGGHQFIKKVLLNPQMARYATGLLTAPPQSQAAKRATRAILLGMKGAQVGFLSPDGKEHQAEIQNDGRIKLLD